MWACPHCREALQLNTAGNAWACANSHQFDCAKEGYVNLLPANRKRSAHPGDSPEMIAARRRVHEAGLYGRLAKGIEALLSPAEHIENMLDLGCGEGYYSGALQGAQYRAQLYGIDIAKQAVRMAAKHHKHGHYAVASAYQLPLPDDSQGIVLRVFAPSDDKEVRRVLAPGGFYLEVTPAPRHLWELREGLYDTPREHTESRTGLPGMRLQQQEEVSYRASLDPSLLRDVIAMTPFSHRGHREKRAQLLQSEGLTVQMAFSLCLFQLDDSDHRSKFG
jgi:23S rRNA (guanine745-N1)-methyltransferase